MKIFYTYSESREAAAEVLYKGIKKHLIEFAEDHKEYQMDEDPNIEINQMYDEMDEHEEDPQGDYEL